MGAHPVIVFDRAGRFLRSWGGGTIVRALGIYITADDRLFLTDDQDHTVTEYTLHGERVMTLGTGCGANDDPVPGGAGPQTRQCLEYVKEVLALAGASLDDVTMVNVYLHDLDRDYDAMNAVYREYFGNDRLPARATVGVSRLAKGLLVEISCIAVTGSSG